MILDQAMNVIEKLIKELKESNPEKRDHFIKSAVTLLEVSIEVMKISPEFRRAFAMVHSEFFKYPECQETLQIGLDAYENYLH